MDGAQKNIVFGPGRKKVELFIIRFHSEQPKLHRVHSVLSAIGFSYRHMQDDTIEENKTQVNYI